MEDPGLSTIKGSEIEKKEPRTSERISKSVPDWLVREGSHDEGMPSVLQM